MLFEAPLFGAGGIELRGLVQTTALGVDFDDLGAVNEAVYESDLELEVGVAVS